MLYEIKTLKDVDRFVDTAVENAKDIPVTDYGFELTAAWYGEKLVEAFMKPITAYVFLAEDPCLPAGDRSFRSVKLLQDGVIPGRSPDEPDDFRRLISKTEEEGENSRLIRYMGDYYCLYEQRNMKSRTLIRKLAAKAIENACPDLEKDTNKGIYSLDDVESYVEALLRKNMDKPFRIGNYSFFYREADMLWTRGIETSLKAAIAYTFLITNADLTAKKRDLRAAAGLVGSFPAKEEAVDALLGPELERIKDREPEDVIAYIRKNFFIYMLSAEHTRQTVKEAAVAILEAEF